MKRAAVKSMCHSERMKRCQCHSELRKAADLYFYLPWKEQQESTSWLEDFRNEVCLFFTFSFFKMNGSVTLGFGVLIDFCNGKPNDHEDYTVVYCGERPPAVMLTGLCVWANDTEGEL